VTESKFYDVDPSDPESPVVLEEYRTPRGFMLRPGMGVRYENEAWLQPDGTYKTGGMDGPLVITEIIGFPVIEPHEVLPPQAILNNGEWEVNADNLVPIA